MKLGHNTFPNNQLHALQVLHTVTAQVTRLQVCIDMCNAIQCSPY